MVWVLYCTTAFTLLALALKVSVLGPHRINNISILRINNISILRSRTDDSCIQQWHGFGQELVKKVHACTLLMYMCYTVRQLLQYSVLNRLHPLDGCGMIIGTRG
ncbi:hypothetical protein VOLCADRAFT_88114 [Volvox carteri f. nagariensis]|uniref:Secreted protein n=1 Tax=Volvox carteri f. nagariensis TaxID=3068 RepID=D8TNB4_VOLCA|nr:uncharacterized protein VOLCADRAFT_88114 [Volvox carteri f. nagariensis]EFJ50960.1 hypothetical protein VOLCADRAFT_88114 [Volvox carteri f. nagariensis]|eukprot:XP_002947972.1 hypothetical protein VOLCADRAFT_88114 [Volvox carteri f. nagariensis]